MIAFVTALDLSDVNLLGFSIGGFVAQEMALIRPARVRRLVLAASGPKGAPRMHGWREDIAEAAGLEPGTAESLLHIFFAPTETSRALGGEFLGASWPALPDADHRGGRRPDDPDRAIREQECASRPMSCSGGRSLVRVASVMDAQAAIIDGPAASVRAPLDLASSAQGAG